METASWRLEGGLNLVRGALTRNRYPRRARRMPQC